MWMEERTGLNMKLRFPLALALFCFILPLVCPAVKADTVLNIVLRPRYYNGSKDVSSPLCDNAIPPDLNLNIVLAPPNATSQQAGPTCGFEYSIDPNRMLGELNRQMVFELLYESQDPNPVYGTRVIEIVKFNSSDKPVHNVTTVDESGLFSLFIAPPNAECDEQVLEIAAASETEYYPVYVSNSGNFTQTIGMFLSEAACLKKHHYQGNNPKLCGTVTPMKQMAANAIDDNLQSVFNLPYNNNRNLMLKLKYQSCKTAADTVKALKKSEAFDKTLDAFFERNVYSALDVEFTLAEIKTAADYDNMCLYCSAILVGVGTSLQKYDTYETGYIETAIKVTKNYLGPKIEYLVAAGIMKIRSGKTALETVDFSVFGAEASVHASSKSAEAGAKVVLAGGSVSIFDLQLGLGVSTGGGIIDDSVVVEVAGWGFSFGRKMGLCASDNCFSVDFGKLFG